MKTSSALVVNVPFAAFCPELLVIIWLESTMAAATVVTLSVALLSLKNMKNNSNYLLYCAFFLSYISSITESGRKSSKFIIAMFTADTMSEPK